MKARTAFVSNSSSSSFVVVIRKSAYDELMPTLSESCQQTIADVAEESNCLGTQIVSVGDLSVMDNSYNFGDCYNDWWEFREAVDEKVNQDDKWRWGMG